MAVNPAEVLLLGYPVDVDELLGMSLRERRLEVLMLAGSREPQQWYSAGEPCGDICIMCGRAGYGDRAGCDREFEQVMMFGRYLLSRGVRPFGRATA